MNISMEITTTLQYLSRVRSVLENNYKLSVSTINIVDAMKPVMSNYGGAVRTKTKEYREKMNKSQNILLSADNQLFVSSMVDINQNKNLDIVISTLNRYQSFYVYYKKRLKDFKRLLDLSKIKEEEAMRSSDYIKAIGMKKISIGIEKEINFINHILNRLSYLLPNVK